MRSNGTPDLGEFLDGTITTAEDVVMLHRVRSLDSLDPVAYFRSLLGFTDLHPHGREIPPHHELFVL